MKKKVPAIATITLFLSLATIATGMILARASKTNASEIGKEYTATYVGTGEVPPPGAWSLICAPSLERQPIVDAYSVTSERGDKVTKVTLRNRSDKAVIAVKLGWRLFHYSSPKNTLMSGESPLLGVPLGVKERRVVEFPLVSFAKISKSLMKNGRVDGDFKIEVIVTDVIFEDSGEKTSKSGWRNSLLASFLPSATGSGAKRPIVEVVSYAAPPIDEGCQNQECKYVEGCYQCQALNGTTCNPKGTGGCQSCEESACQNQ